jgi:hypothetical protein
MLQHTMAFKYSESHHMSQGFCVLMLLLLASVQAPDTPYGENTPSQEAHAHLQAWVAPVLRIPPQGPFTRMNHTPSLIYMLLV